MLSQGNISSICYLKHILDNCKGQPKSIIKKRALPLARLRLRLPTREGEVKYLSQWGKYKTPDTPVSPGRARLLYFNLAKSPRLTPQSTPPQCFHGLKFPFSPIQQRILQGQRQVPEQQHQFLYPYLPLSIEFL